MAQFQSLEHVQVTRKKRLEVFEKARRMRESGRISEGEFQLLTTKFEQKMADLDAAEAAFKAQAAAVPVAPASADDVLGMARDILGAGGRGDGAEAPGPGATGVDLDPDPAPDPGPGPGPGLDLDPGPGPEPADTGFGSDLGPEPADTGFGSDLEDPDDPENANTEPPPRPARLDDDPVLLGGDEPEEDAGGDIWAGVELPEGADPDPAADTFVGRGPGVVPIIDGAPEVMPDLDGIDLGDDDDLGEHGASPGGLLSAVGKDTDLLSLVRGSFSRDEDSGSDYDLRAQSERSAREAAERRASAKETEAAEMHEAFRRAVDEKDRLGAKLVARTREAEKFKKATFGLMAMTLLFLGVSGWLGRGRAAAVKEAAGLRGRLNGAEVKRKAAEAKAKEGAAALAEAHRRRVADASAADAEAARLKAAVRAAQLRHDELTDELAAATQAAADRAAAKTPDARRDPDLLALFLARSRRPGLSAPEFLAAAEADGLDAAGVLRELAVREAAPETAGAAPIEALRKALAGDAAGTVPPLTRWLEARRGEASRLRGALASWLVEAGEGNRAMAMLEGVAPTDPGFLDAKRALAAVYRKARRLGDARRVLSQVLAAPGATHEDYLQAGMLADMAGDAAAAEEAYRYVFGRDPANVRAVSLLSSLAIQRADWAGAEALLRPVVADTPGDNDLKYNLAVAYLGLEKRAEAEVLLVQLARAGWPGVPELAAKAGIDVPPPAGAPPTPTAGTASTPTDAPSPPEDPATAGRGGLPGDDRPGDDLPGNDLPGDDLPGSELPGDDLPGSEPLPADDFPEDGDGGDDGLDDDLPGFE